MPPKLASDNGEHIVIRPLAYNKEKDIEQYSQAMEFPIIPCNLCGSQENLQRKQIKQMLNQWDRQFPGRVESIFTAMQNVAPSHLADNNLFDFLSVMADGVAKEDGDKAFDDEPIQNKQFVASDDYDSENSGVQSISIKQLA